MNKNGKIVLFTGLTASGKDECQKILMEEYNANPVVSFTTRPMRDGEVDGVNYHYTDKETFLDMVDTGIIFEYREYNTLVDNIPEKWYYGASVNEVKEDRLNVVVVDTTGTRCFVEEFGKDRCIVIYVRTPHPEINRELCIKRKDYNQPEFDRRMTTDTPKYNAEFLNEYVDYLLVNQGDSLEQLFLEVTSLMKEIGINE